MKKAFGIGCGGTVLLVGCLIAAVVAVNLSGGNGTTAARGTNVPAATVASRPTSAVAAATVAPTAAPTARPATKAPTAIAPVRYALNQPVAVKHWRLAVTQAQKVGKELEWTQFGNKETAAGAWYVVTVTMTNTGNENFGVNIWDFELRDGAGATYKVSDTFAAYAYSEYQGGQRVGGQVPPGVAVMYYLVFDITPNATGLHLVFKQDARPDFALE